jgi:hypothetical protein
MPGFHCSCLSPAQLPVTAGRGVGCCIVSLGRRPPPTMVSLQCVLWATSGTTACSRYGRRCFLEAAFDHQKTSTNSPRVRRHHSGGYCQSGGSWKRSNAAVLCLLPVLLKLDDDVIDWNEQSSLPRPPPNNEPVPHFSSFRSRGEITQFSHSLP